jgi:hypothetical protein
MSAHPCNQGAGCGIPEWVTIDDIHSVHRDAKLAEMASEAMYVEGLVRRKLRRHPGGDECLAGSDRTVVDVDAAHWSTQSEETPRRRLGRSSYDPDVSAGSTAPHRSSGQ